MPERLHPGVYVEEISGGVKPIEGVATSTSAFVGEAARGVPGLAQFVTNFGEFEKAFGGHLPGEAGLLAQAVDGFFAAGGQRAYVVRVLPSDALVGASDDVPSRAPDIGFGIPDALLFRAKGAGVWSENIRIDIADSRNFPGDAFSINVNWTEAGATQTLETFADVRMDPKSEDYVGERVNTVSRYVEVVDDLELAIAALPAGGVLLAPQGPVLKAAVAASYRLQDGTTLQVVGQDTADPNADPITSKITITPDAVAAAIPANTPTFVNGTVSLTGAQLATVLSSLLKDDQGNALFSVTNTDSPEIAMLVGRGPTATITVPAAGTFDLTGQHVHVAFGANDAVDINVAAAHANAVTPRELAAALASGLAGRVTSVVVRGSSIIVTADGNAAGNATIALDSAPDAARLTVASAAGTAGITADRFDGLRLSISEFLNPRVQPMLRQLGFPPKAQGYTANSPANPLARPTPVQGLRLVGGDDGDGLLTTSDYIGDPVDHTGLHALDGIDVNLVALPGKNDPAFISAGIGYCDGRGDCFFLADGPGSVERDFSIGPSDAKQFIEGLPSRSNNAAMFFPWIQVPDPVGIGRNPTRLVPPSGLIAGIFARTDNTRGVWKAPAGIEATVPDALGLQVHLADEDQDLLNPVSLNCMRQFPGVGIVSWGTRTLASDPEWRYVPVRRTALFLKESLRRGLLWAVFEPNDQELWGRIQINIQAFMLGLFRQGAFQGATPDEAFRVVCDRTTNPQELVDQGIVTAEVAFAPLKPAEFVVIQISQKSLLVQ
jgi:phage tail sheath protein FI